MRPERVLFHDGEGCLRSLAELRAFIDEGPALTDDGLVSLDAVIAGGFASHARIHLSALLDDGRDAALRLIDEFAERPTLEALPQLLEAIDGINRARGYSLDSIRERLSREFPDAPWVAERLALMAGRWLTGGMPRNRPAGSAVIAGPWGSGRSRVVSRFAAALRSENAGDPVPVEEVDLREFADGESGLRRLVERLEALARDPGRRVIAFDNVEHADPGAMPLLQRLVETGSLGASAAATSLDNRFLFFMLARGMRGDESPAVVPRAVRQELGNGFLSAVQQVIVLPRPADSVLEKMISRHADDFCRDFEAHTGQRIEVDPAVHRALVLQVLERGGYGHSVAAVVEERLRLPVADLRVGGELVPGVARVIVESGRLSLVQGVQRRALPAAGHDGSGADAGFDLERELAGLVGLDPVKDMLRSLRKQLLADQRRRDAGIDARTRQSLHMLFLGNPGTGKTTVARLVARMLRELGLLREGQLVEVGRSDLVASYVGQTAPRTRAVVERAIGGVLFIDEAYSLTRGQDAFGREAVDTLVREIENHRDDLVVILAGYTREMQEFLESNPGLTSRFPHRIEFPDYLAGQLAEIAGIEARGRGFQLDPGATEGLPRLFDGLLVAGRHDQGNGRLARTVVEAAIRRQSARVAERTVVERDALVTLVAEDFGSADGDGATTAKDALSMLDDVVGLHDIKEFVRDLAAQVQVDTRRRQMGLSAGEARTLHMVFKGSPGTGKTTVARIVGRLLRELRILKLGHVVEVDRSGLVAGYVGQTALKTQARIREALGGLLFVDEAYALAGDAQDAFGREALDTLVKGMEDHRDSLVVVLAGYSRDMDRLLDVNAGLRSRFPNVIEFRDYTPAELQEIAAKLFAARQLAPTGAAWARVRMLCESAAGDASAGNGRFVRNLVEETARRQARRLMRSPEPGRDELTTVEAEDLPPVRDGA